MSPGLPTTSKRILFITDFYEHESLLGVVEYAKRRNWELIANMRFHGQFPSETEADGILVTGYSQRVQRWLEDWRGTPTIHIGEAPPALPLPWVDVDFTAAGRVGARHLMELGQVHHAFYALSTHSDTVRIRASFEEELRKSGLKPIRIDFTGEHEGSALDIPREERLNRLAAKLKSQPMPLAVMTCDDRRSLELIAACEIAGLRVPEDVSILGCENRQVEIEMSPVSLSSVDLNRRLVGRKAAELLDQLMNGGEAPAENLTVPPRAVVGRASTSTFATGNPGITRSIIHLRDHFAKPVKLADLAKMAGMSERYFREEFKRLVGHSPREEILRSRMASAACLLRDTDFKLEAIAAESGLGSAKKLCEFFGRIHGMTPHRWRLQAHQGKLPENAT